MFIACSSMFQYVHSMFQYEPCASSIVVPNPPKGKSSALTVYTILQLNQIKDYLNKGDAEVFSKCIVPFLKADSYLQSGEISEDTFTVMLHTCLINWLDNDTTTQEKVVVSLEDTMDKCAPFSLPLP